MKTAAVIAVALCACGIVTHIPASAATDCTDPGTPVNGTQSGTYTDGGMVQFTCDSGFTLIGSRFIFCNSGTWSGSVPTCYPDCTDPGTPDDGSQVGSPDYTFGSTLEFACDSGFILIGRKYINCEGGTWSGDVPSCIPGCGDPGTPTNGNQVGSPDYSAGSTVTFACDSDYSLIGSSSITCESGNWSDPIPECLADCGDPGTPSNGQQDGSPDYSHGSTVSFSCDSGIRWSATV
ncbi:C4b-binding protein-like [Ptychodera flava]|uniref:C4b-binding protein-like n=1 Tax=Ptychodera flava TaxID=63121 RepID=UPI00396A34A8